MEKYRQFLEFATAEHIKATEAYTFSSEKSTALHVELKQCKSNLSRCEDTWTNDKSNKDLLMEASAQFVKHIDLIIDNQIECAKAHALHQSTTLQLKLAEDYWLKDSRKYF